MAQQVKDLALPQLWCELRWRGGFTPWLGNFHIAAGAGKKKKKKVKMVNFMSCIFFFLPPSKI